MVAGVSGRHFSAAINFVQRRRLSRSRNQSQQRFALSSFIPITHARESRARSCARCEDEARAQGFRALELMATLPGIEFYKSCGFVETGNFDLDLDRSEVNSSSLADATKKI